MSNLSAFLSQVEPFSRLPAEEVERLALLSQVVRHTKGEVLYNEGERGAQVWVLLQGRLDIFKYNSDGKALAIESIQPKQLFGTLCRLGALSATIYPCTAIAATDCQSIRIPDRFFNSLYNRFPVMVSSTCQLCSGRLRLMQSNATSYQEPVKQRIVKVLFQLRQRYGDELHCTKREISELAGTTVETTIRVLSDFKKRRWIASQRGRITLREVTALRSCLPEVQVPVLHGENTPLLNALTV
jgi:CRP-like cAMP-binding protein